MASKARSLTAKILTFILFGLLILSFAVWGIGDMFRGGGQIAVVAEVGDIEIPRERFQRNLSSEINRVSAALGTRIDAEQAMQFGLVNQVLSQMVTRALLDQQADDLGMVVTDEQIREAILEEPAFQDSLGNFSRERFIQVLRGSGLSEDEFIASLRRDVKRQQITSAFTGAVTVPAPLAEAMYRRNAQQRIARYIELPFDSVGEIEPPDDETLARFLEENQANFMAPEYRRVSLIELRPERLAQEIAIPEEQLREAFEARRENFAVPERRRIEQMVFSDKAKADDAMARLSEGTAFTAVAEELTGRPPVDLGAVSHDEIVPELAESAFALAENGIAGPVRSPLGWHVLRVTEILPGREPDFAEAREQLARDLAMDQAIDSIISIANQLDDALAGGASLEEAARSQGLEVRTIEAVDRQGRTPQGEPVADLPPGGRFLDSVFSTPEGQPTLLTETPTGGYFAARVNDIMPAAPRPLEEVRERVVDLWIETERERRLRERAAALVERLEQGATLESLATEAGGEVQTSAPLTRFDDQVPPAPARELASRLFQIAEGEAVAVPGPDGYLVARLSEIRTPDPSENPEAVEQVREELAGSLRDDLLTQYLTGLRTRYPTRINDSVVEQAVQAF